MKILAGAISKLRLRVIRLMLKLVAPDPVARRMLASLKIAVKDAWRVIMLCPDPDIRFRAGLASGWYFPVVQDARDAYGSSVATAAARPTPQDITRMEVVMEWMAWLRRLAPQDGGGDGALRRIIGWSLGRPLWLIAQREGCTGRTIENRIDRSLAAILGEFQSIHLEIDVINEPPPSRRRIRSTTEGQAHTPPSVGGVDELRPGKVWIDGVGFMCFGKRYKSAQISAGG